MIQQHIIRWYNFNIAVTVIETFTILVIHLKKAIKGWEHNKTAFASNNQIP